MSCSNNRENAQNQHRYIIIQPGTKTIIDEQYREMNIFTVDIPDTVTYIGDFAFFGNELEEVTLPENLTEIGIGAFRDNNLKKIIIPNSVTNITLGAFANNKLTEITISNNISFIGSQSFANNLLTKIIIPDNVKTIHYGAFSDNRITEIIIGSDVKFWKTEHFNNIFGEFDGLFCEYYTENNRRAGTYRYNEYLGAWEYF
jgi:hypothetical protein